MAFTGQDIEAVRTLSAQMDQQATQIEQVAATLTNQLQQTQWVGADRERYVGDWNSSHRTALMKVAEALKDAANVARQNATQQEQASA